MILIFLKNLEVNFFEKSSKLLELINLKLNILDAIGNGCNVFDGGRVFFNRTCYIPLFINIITLLHGVYFYLRE